MRITGPSIVLIGFVSVGCSASGFGPSERAPAQTPRDIPICELIDTLVTASTDLHDGVKELKEGRTNTGGRLVTAASGEVAAVLSQRWMPSSRTERLAALAWANVGRSELDSAKAIVGSRPVSDWAAIDASLLLTEELVASAWAATDRAAIQCAGPARTTGPST